MRARYYNPDVHRFVSTDILEGDISDPLSLNRYAYCSNNPITYLDPTGYVSFNPGDWLNAHNPGNYLNEINDQYIGGPLNQIASGDYTPIENAIIFLDDVGNATMVMPAVGASFKGVSGLGKGALKLGKAKTVVSGKAAIKGAGKIETKVIGHFPDYINLSKDMGIKPFDIPINVWNKMTPAEQWAANTKFLDRAIAKNSEFVLATPIKEMKPGSYFEREVEYLFSKGYKLSSDGTKLIK